MWAHDSVLMAWRISAVQSCRHAQSAVTSPEGKQSPLNSNKGMNMNLHLLCTQHTTEGPVAAAHAAVAYISQQLSRAVAAIAPVDSDTSAVKVTTTKLLATWSAEPDRRDALLAVGGNTLLDYLINSCCEDPSIQQIQAEQALCNFLSGSLTATRVLQRPGAVPRLLQHVASGKASEQLPMMLSLAAAGGADLSGSLHLDDGRNTLKLLGGRHGSQVSVCALCSRTCLYKSSY